MYDILGSCKITPNNFSEILILECADKDIAKDCDFKNAKVLYCICYASH